MSARRRRFVGTKARLRRELDARLRARAHHGRCRAARRALAAAAFGGGVGALVLGHPGAAFGFAALLGLGWAASGVAPSPHDERALRLLRDLLDELETDPVAPIRLEFGGDAQNRLVVAWLSPMEVRVTMRVDRTPSGHRVTASRERHGRRMGGPVAPVGRWTSQGEGFVIDELDASALAFLAHALAEVGADEVAVQRPASQDASAGGKR